MEDKVITTGQYHKTVEDLLQEIEKPTPVKQAQASVIDEKTADENTTNTAENTGAGQQVKPPPTDAMIESGADVVIVMADFTQTNLFKFGTNIKKKNRIKKRYGADANDRLRLLIDEITGTVENNNKASIEDLKVLTDVDKGLLGIHKKFDDFIQELPLSDDEKHAIKVPLMQLMKENGGTIPPSVMLWLTGIQIFGSRVADLALL